jgi:anhydro-N-acetylmuramic acid kinase
MVYQVIGLMSGSSMDGLDIAYCTIEETGGKWSAQIEIADCISFSEEWKNKLATLNTLSLSDFFVTHTSFGKWIGVQVNEFIEKYNLHHKVHLLASHGHTAIHLPKQYTTVQIGCGAAIAANTGITTISDLRNMDVALEGNGAPIVPICEKLLFPEYNYFLNIGGICNISVVNQSNYFAFDVCPANRVMNALANNVLQAFDKNGELAASGRVNDELLSQLNSLDYYSTPAPKSLSNEFGTDIVFPLIQNSNCSTPDKLATMAEHIAIQIKNSILPYAKNNEEQKLLVTGGGAWNSFLISRIQYHLKALQIIIEIPEESIVNYKESLAMAIIGVLRWREETNVLASVTGASRDSIGGALWMGNQ